MAAPRQLIPSVCHAHGAGDVVEVKGADGAWTSATVRWVGHMNREPGDPDDVERVYWLGCELMSASAPSFAAEVGNKHDGYTHHAQYFRTAPGRATFVRESESRNTPERDALIADANAQPVPPVFTVGMRVANVHNGAQLGTVMFVGHVEGHIAADGDDPDDVPLAADEQYVGIEYDNSVGALVGFEHHGAELWEGEHQHCELMHESDAKAHLRMSSRPKALKIPPSAPSADVVVDIDDTPDVAESALSAAQAELELLCARASNMQARRLAEACFGEMDFDGNGTLSKTEFAAAWFKGQVMDGPVLTDKFRRAGGDPAADMITKLSFVFTIVKRHAGVSSSKQMLMKKTLKTFVKQTHEIRIKRMKEVEEAQKYMYLEQKANKCDDQAKEIVLLKAQLANAELLRTTLAQEKEKCSALNTRLTGAQEEKTQLKLKCVRTEAKLHAIESMPPPPAPAAAAAVAEEKTGATEEERAAFEAQLGELRTRVDELQEANVTSEDALEHATADLTAAIKAKEDAEASAQSMQELVEATQKELEKIRAEKMITQDWGPLCVSQKANTAAALTSIPLEVKGLQNRLDDLTAAMRVLVRVRPLLLGNPDAKKLGMDKKKSLLYCRKAMKWQVKGKAAGLKFPYLTEEQDKKFNVLRRKDEEAEDCVVADAENQSISVCKKGVVIQHGTFKPLSDVMPYGGPYDHPKSRPQATNACVWERIEPLVTSALRRTPNNVVVFAYGGTGSGKTYTMGGFDSKDSEAENRKHAMGMGQVFFNAVKTMLDEVETYTVAATSRKVGVQYSLAFMMADNYLDTMSDLLSPAKTDKGRMRTKSVHAFGASGDGWQDFTRCPFASFDDFWAGYVEGIKLRKVESAMNDDSSRSHLCMCFEVTRREIDTYGTVSRECISKVILVDLAGSESQREVQHRIETTWIGDKPSLMAYSKKARQQTIAINAALKSLQVCIQEISKAIKKAAASADGVLKIPHKAFGSLLTKLLSIALKPCALKAIGGVESEEIPKASRIMMVCCVAAAGTWRTTTMSSLGFAAECMKIKLESPAQLALKGPLIEKLEETKQDCLDLQEECEHFLNEHTQEELLQLDDEEQKLWHDKALAYSKMISKKHKSVARVMAAKVPTAAAGGAAATKKAGHRNIISKVTGGHFGEGKHRRKTAAILQKL